MNSTRGTWYQLRLTLMTAALTLSTLSLGLSGCGEVMDLPADGATAAPEPTPALSTTPEGLSYVTLARFQGYADPANGIFELWMVEEPTQVSDDGDLRTAGQQLPFCSLNVQADGNAGTNPVNSIQIYNLPNTTETTITDCRADTPTGNHSNGFASGGAVDVWDTLFGENGIWCSNVRIDNFYTRSFDRIYAEIETFNGQAGQAGLGQTFGSMGLDDDLIGDDAPVATFGLWDYGPMTARAGGYDGVTIQWSVGLPSAAPFDFEGRVVAVQQETCGDLITNNCNATVDEGCGTFADAAPCTDDLDCVSGLCDEIGGTCSTTCAPGFYGESCDPCPSNVGGVCGGVDRGACDDGAAGEGECECTQGVHGDSCEFSCSDGDMNGDESAVDCGGPCPMLEICNGKDDDCDGLIDERDVCGATTVTIGSRGYIVIPTTDTYGNQRTACQAYFGYDIMRVNDDSEWTAVETGLGLSGEYWIGVNDLDSNSTMTELNTGLAPAYESWGASQPDDMPTSCVFMDTASNDFFDVGCTSLRATVCEQYEVLSDLTGMSDVDGDSIPDGGDPCVNDPANDGDMDGQCADDDNCDDHYNPGQANSDGDAHGDRCDACDDDVSNTCSMSSDGECPCTCDRFNDIDCTNTCGDGVVEGSENCDQIEGNGIRDDWCRTIDSGCDDSDPCTADYLATGGLTDEQRFNIKDGNFDEVNVCAGRCVSIPMPNGSRPLTCSCSEDWHCVGAHVCNTSNVCEADTDGDTVADSDDNCVNRVNLSQTDTDADSVGDACDPDQDDDLIPNEIDLAPTCAAPLHLSGIICANWTAAGFDESTWDDTVAVGAEPLAMAVGDLDGDGDDDVAVVNNHASQGADSELRVFLRNDSGESYTAETPLTLAGARDAETITIENVDGDSDNDLLIGWLDNDGYWTVALNDGSADFSSNSEERSETSDGCTGPAEDGSASRTMAIATGNIDGDVDMDVVIAAEGVSGNDFFEIWEWNGSSFDCEVHQGPTGITDEFTGAVIGDFEEGNGSLEEVALGTEAGIAIWVPTSISAGTLNKCDDVSEPSGDDTCTDDLGRAWVDRYDIDGDSNEDLVVLFDGGNNELRAYFGDGDATFSLRRTFSGNQPSNSRHVWPNPRGFVVADWWSDANFDLFLASADNDMLIHYHRKRTQQNLNGRGETLPGDQPWGIGYSMIEDRLVVINRGDNTISWREGTQNLVNEHSAGTTIGDQHAVFDADGDGALDFVLADERPNGSTLRFFLNRDDSTGLLDPHDNATGGSGKIGLGFQKTAGISVTDLNQDGHLDIVFAEYTDGGNIYWIENEQAAPYFSLSNLVSVGTFSAGHDPAATLTVDVNGDGFSDVVAVSEQGTVLVWTVNVPPFGSPSFSGPTTLTADATVYDIGAADLEGDGDIDLVVPASTGTLYFFTNNGSGSFATSTLAQSGGPSFIDIADLDGDNDADLVISLRTDDDVAVLENTGSGFTDTTYSADTTPSSVEIVDFSGDGNLDFLVGNETTKQLRLFTSDGVGGYTASTVATASAPMELNLGDFDGDDQVDVLYEMDYFHGGIADTAVHLGE